MRWIVFLDRDGVINKKAPEHDYIRKKEDFIILPWVFEFIEWIRELWFSIIIITNQQWVGKWVMSRQDLDDIHDLLRLAARESWTEIDAIYSCTHLVSDNCTCRKPKTWLFEKAVADFQFYDKSKMLFIGDSPSDMEAAKNFSIRWILIPSDRLEDSSREILIEIQKMTE
jgi:D-glycero-D-manno-heptose 1,7-bisphosphate phosphatase